MTNRPVPLQTEPFEDPEPGSTAALLEAVRRDNATLDERRLDLYLGHLGAGEDELAWEVLVRAADRSGASSVAWETLFEAAQRMELGPDDGIHSDAYRIVMQQRQG